MNNQRMTRLPFRDPVLDQVFNHNERPRRGKARSFSNKQKQKRYRSAEDIVFGTLGVGSGGTILTLSALYLDRFESALGDLRYVIPAAAAVALGCGVSLLRGKK